MSDQNQADVTGLPSDADLFSSATSPPAPASDTGGADQQQQPPQQGAEQQPQGGQPRDEHGRFAAKTPTDPKDGAAQQQQPPPAQQQATPQAPPVPDPAQQQQRGQGDGDANVPSWRLREEREAREAAIRRAENAERAAAEVQRRFETMLREQQQARQEPIDPLADPQGYASAIRDEHRRELQHLRLESNLQLNHVRHGETFEKAYNAFIQAAPSNPAWAQSVVGSPNPGQAMVNWFMREQTYSEVGNDPAAYKQKLLDDALKDPAYLAKAVAAAQATATGQAPQPGRPQNVTQMPVSLSRVAGGGPTPPSLDPNDMSDAALFRHATARG